MKVHGVPIAEASLGAGQQWQFLIFWGFGLWWIFYYYVKIRIGGRGWWQATSGFLVCTDQDPKGLTKRVKMHSTDGIWLVICNYSRIKLTSNRPSRVLLACQCPSKYYCLIYPHTPRHLKSLSTATLFPTSCWVEQRPIDTSLSDADLRTWAKKEKISLGHLIPSKKARTDVLRLLYTYRVLAATELSDIPTTDQIQYWVPFAEGTRPYKLRARRYTHDKW